jgi:hypothetical protein
MSHEVYCVAKTEEQAYQFVGRLKAMGVEPDKVSVVVERSEIEHLAHPDSKHFRDMKIGAIGGAIIGFGYGAATLVVIGAAAIPGLLGASLLLGFASLGGVLLGGIIGSTGIFARPLMPPAVEQEYEAEVSRGRILISVVAHNEKERDQFMEVMNYWGASDIHYSGEAVA